MLIKCPECDLQVSDKAITCPHCGYPLKPEKAAKQSVPRRMRLPNGFGQITKITTKPLRNPWRVMVTIGRTPEGKPIQKILKPTGYFATYNEAYEALLKYHKNPIDLSESTTLQELYERWSSEHFEELSSGTANNAKSTWKWFSSVYDLKVTSLTKNTIRNIYGTATMYKNGELSTPSSVVLLRMKQMLDSMLDYAVAHDIITINISKQVPLPKAVRRDADSVKKAHTNFTPEELNILWGCLDDPLVRMILIDCYMGWRPQELITLKKSDVNISDMTITAGMKTEAGKGRLVPIHSKIQDLVMGFYNESDSEFLFPSKYQKYSKYIYRFGIKMEELKAEHRPHDCRVTFVTMAKNAKVDDIAIKRLVGHRIDDITESIYTKRNLDWFREEIEKIK